MHVELETLRSEVEQNSSVINSAVVLLQELAAKLSDVASDPVAVQALADQLHNSSAALAAAVQANTPSAPSVEVVEEVVEEVDPVIV
ncbi:MAG: hypothetical protein E4H07_07035 [Nitrosomonadales bacterium]|nr:MAG: hypothetical protein E4H07_07035 [Nitrosomonadales bacterium]